MAEKTIVLPSARTIIRKLKMIDSDKSALPFYRLIAEHAGERKTAKGLAGLISRSIQQVGKDDLLLQSIMYALLPLWLEVLVHDFDFTDRVISHVNKVK